MRSARYPPTTEAQEAADAVQARHCAGLHRGVPAPDEVEDQKRKDEAAEPVDKCAQVEHPGCAGKITECLPEVNLRRHALHHTCEVGR